MAIKSISMPDPVREDLPAFRLYYAPGAQALAERYAQRFVVRCGEPYPLDHPDFALWAVDDHLELRRKGDRRGVWMDRKDLDRRAGSRTELVRACGLSPSGPRLDGLRVLDAMAGWGLDGLVLARLGCEVLMVEQHPLLHALLEDFARRSAMANVQVELGDGYERLGSEARYAVVYLDPMFPRRRKQALPGKRMQYLAELEVESKRALATWLAAALVCTTQRVVVKRRLSDPAVAAPDWQIRGRAIRYDVYRGRAEQG